MFRVEEREEGRRALKIGLKRTAAGCCVLIARSLVTMVVQSGCALCGGVNDKATSLDNVPFRVHKGLVARYDLEQGHCDIDKDIARSSDFRKVATTG